MSGGGRFDFDDGGTYCGGWEDGKAHGHGVCTGPKGQGEYAGAWQLGFEMNGVYLWPSGNRYEGQWTQGKRHGLGTETKGRWSYKGEWTQGFKGRYGVRLSTSSGARYEGTWTTGLQDGYGVETYADGGEYKGQWLRGMRHGYGTRQSVPYGVAATFHAKTQLQISSSTPSATDVDEDKRDRINRVDESRGGFVLKSRSDDAPATTGGRRSFLDKHSKGTIGKILRLSLRKQHSTGDLQDPNAGRRPMSASMRSTASTMSRLSQDSGKTAMTSGSVTTTDSNHSFVTQDDAIEAGVIETYFGEWKNDKRSGFGVSERTDGLKYQGEWYNNKKYGYGVTTFRDGTKEEGKYKNNVLVSSGNKSKILYALRSSKLRERIDSAVAAAQRASQIARQKADIAVSRMQTAKAKSELAEVAAQKARTDADLARKKAKEFAPDFQQTGVNASQRSGDDLVGENEFFKQKAVPNHSTIPNNVRANNSTANASSNYYPSAPPMTAAIPSGMGLGPSTNVSRQPSQLDARPNSTMRSVSHAPSSNIMPSTAALQQASVSKANTLDRLSNAKAYQRQDSVGSSVSSRQTNIASDSLRKQADRDNVPKINPPEYTDLVDSDEAGSYYGNGFRNRMERSKSPSRESNVTSSDYGSIVFGRSNLTRRKSLPSIVKNKNEAPPSESTKPAPKTKDKRKMPKLSRLNSSEQDKLLNSDYVIENGVRKRIMAEESGFTSTLTKDATLDGTSRSLGVNSPLSNDGESEDVVVDLPRRYRVETPRLQRRAANMGSLPDVSVCNELGQSVMPREQVHILSEKRREELRRLREEEERRRHMQVVLSLYDFKDWCQQRQMLMLILALNIGLATMFFNLLSR